MVTRAAEPEEVIFGGAGAVFKIYLEPELVVCLAAPAPDPFWDASSNTICWVRWKTRLSELIHALQHLAIVNYELW